MAAPAGDVVARTSGVRLGWRWVPGVARAWRATMVRTAGEVSVTRAEEWSYTARQLDDRGVVHLEGLLRGIGASAQVKNKSLPDHLLAPAREEEIARTVREMEMMLALSGRIQRCSITNFAASLPHRMLGMHLPSLTVRPGDAWSDPALTLPFTSLLPIDLPLRATAATRLESLRTDRGQLLANLTHRGELLSTVEGPRLDIDGRTVWNATEGTLRDRRLTVRYRPIHHPSDHPPGTLVIMLGRITG